MNSLFGEDFEIKTETVKAKKLAKKINAETEETDTKKALKSKKISLEERLQIINTNVLQILGKQKNNTLVIRDIVTLHNYIDKAIAFGEIAIDTETNNSLDPITCKLMGPCLYVPGEKAAYIPINHINIATGKLLENQLTEEQCKIEFQRLIDNNVKIDMHNGKFDYQVIKCTCGIALPIYWDTMVAARLLNENERAGLKQQYIEKIDPSQEKYSIDHLFENVQYAQVDPEIFALYAATDSMMTYKLKVLQEEELSKDEYGPHLDISGKHMVNGLRWLFHEVEMPIVTITAEMELTGVAVDKEFGKKLKEKYENKLNEVDSAINLELEALRPQIDAWKLTKEANERSKMRPAAKTKMSTEKIEAQYTEVDEIGRFKYGKPRVEQLTDPINLASPTQLAILFYDILKSPQVNKTNPRATGEEEMNAIKEKTNLKICDLLLQRRGIMKLLTTYIDTIPTLTEHWPDGRIRFHLNSLGTDTGRYSSGGKLKFFENGESIEVSGINIQNIPSGSPEIRNLFIGDTKYGEVTSEDNVFIVEEYSEIETDNGWKYCSDLVEGNLLIIDNTPTIYRGRKYLEETKEWAILAYND